MRLGLVTGKANAPYQVPVGDAGGDEDDILAAHEVVEAQDPVQIAEAHRLRAFAFVDIARLETAHETAAQTLERGCREDAFGRAAGAHRHVNAGGPPPRGTRGPSRYAVRGRV